MEPEAQAADPQQKNHTGAGQRASSQGQTGGLWFLPRSHSQEKCLGTTPTPGRPHWPLTREDPIVPVTHAPELSRLPPEPGGLGPPPPHSSELCVPKQMTSLHCVSVPPLHSGQTPSKTLRPLIHGPQRERPGTCNARLLPIFPGRHIWPDPLQMLTSPALPEHGAVAETTGAHLRLFPLLPGVTVHARHSPASWKSAWP